MFENGITQTDKYFAVVSEPRVQHFPPIRHPHSCLLSAVLTTLLPQRGTPDRPAFPFDSE